MIYNTCIFAGIAIYGHSYHRTKSKVPLHSTRSLQGLHEEWEGLEVESLWSPCGIPGIIGTPVELRWDLWGSVRYRLQAYQANLVDMQDRIAINSLLESIWAMQDPCPWPDHLMYYYDQGLARWMPELPPTRTTATVVQFNSGATSGSVGTLLTRGPSSSPQPNSRGIEDRRSGYHALLDTHPN